MSAHQADQPSMLAPLGIGVLPRSEEVLVNQPDYVEAIGHDLGSGKVLPSNAAVGFGEIHHDQLDVVFARQMAQIAVQARFRTTQTEIKHLVAVEIHQRGGIALLAAEEMLIDAEHLGTGPIGHLRDPSPAVALVPALGGSSADRVSAPQLGLGDATIVGLKHFKTEGL